MRTAINPLYRTSRRAKALGYARRSPPARAMADYLLKDHNQRRAGARGNRRLGRPICPESVHPQPKERRPYP
jgi:hypothetical protein